MKKRGNGHDVLDISKNPENEGGVCERGIPVFLRSKDNRLIKLLFNLRHLYTSYVDTVVVSAVICYFSIFLFPAGCIDPVILLLSSFWWLFAFKCGTFACEVFLKHLKYLFSRTDSRLLMLLRVSVCLKIVFLCQVPTIRINQIFVLPTRRAIINNKLWLLPNSTINR